ncbi:MAG: hypothetical protein IJT36_01735 [Alphaproteobacteria bacterium]|nr:hypothetical protein [Alphaproteobacteria bacterium]
MGRGIGRKAEYTKKCSCDNPQWVYDDIEINNNTKEITYQIKCLNCDAFWGTKSHTARELWKHDIDKKPYIWMGYNYKGDKTIRELFDDLDKKRLEFLENQRQSAEEKVILAQKEYDIIDKKVEKFKSQVEIFKKI